MQKIAFKQHIFVHLFVYLMIVGVDVAKTAPKQAKISDLEKYSAKIFKESDCLKSTHLEAKNTPDLLDSIENIARGHKLRQLVKLCEDRQKFDANSCERYKNMHYEWRKAIHEELNVGKLTEIEAAKKHAANKFQSMGINTAGIDCLLKDLIWSNQMYECASRVSLEYRDQKYLKNEVVIVQKGEAISLKLVDCAKKNACKGEKVEFSEWLREHFMEYPVGAEIKQNFRQLIRRKIDERKQLLIKKFADKNINIVKCLQTDYLSGTTEDEQKVDETHREVVWNEQKKVMMSRFSAEEQKYIADIEGSYQDVKKRMTVELKKSRKNKDDILKAAERNFLSFWVKDGIYFLKKIAKKDGKYFLSYYKAGLIPQLSFTITV